MTTAVREKNLTILKDGNIFLYDSYDNKLERVGHSSETKTWMEVVRRWNDGPITKLQGIITPIWGLLNVPAQLGAGYKVIDGELCLNKLVYFIEEQTPLIKGDVVFINTTNPFNLTAAEKAVIKSALEAKSAERLRRKEERARLEEEGSTELLLALRNLLEGNPSFQLVGEEGDSITYYDVATLLNGVEIYKVDAIKFIPKALPELWEKYKDVY